MPKQSVKRNKNISRKVVVTNAIKLHGEKDSSEFGDGSQNATGINWIDLAEEILVMIFGLLSRYDLVHVREVCSQWRRVAVCKWLLPLWRQIDVVFSFEDPNVNNFLEYKLLRAAPVLSSLRFQYMSLSQFSEIASKIVERTKEKEVRRLCFARDCVRDDDFLKVLRCYGSHVEKLSTFGLRIQWTNGREKAIFSHLPNLQSIELMPLKYEKSREDFNSTTSWPQEHNLLFFPRRLNNLYHFKDQLTMITISSHTVLSLPDWEEYILKMPKLKHISLYRESEEIRDESAGFQWSRNGESMSFQVKSFYDSAEFLIQLFFGYGFDRIKTSKLVGELTLSLRSIRMPFVISKIVQVLGMFTNLKRLNLVQRCYCGDNSYCQLDQSAFIKILLSVPKLESLHLKGCKSFLEFDGGDICLRFPRVKIECKKFDLCEEEDD